MQDSFIATIDYVKNMATLSYLRNIFSSLFARRSALYGTIWNESLKQLEVIPFTYQLLFVEDL